ncbi:MAG: type ISP restriction/modification enzyme [bacterium]|nr:type ISP restriction/modification enzyme [bacterium]
MAKSQENPVEVYFSALAEKYQTGQAREHAYRPAFEALIHALDPALKILNDPSRSEHGNPDFVFLRGGITSGYAETKDIDVDLDKTEESDQMERYLGYSNLILTDYLEFRFFRNGSRYGELIRIGHTTDGKLVATPEAFNEIADALADFLAGKPEPIKSGKRLAEIMGGKARRIRDNVRQFLADKSDTDTELLRIYESVKKMLVHDLTPEAFADMYAQTLVYGLFVARYHDESPDNFSRAEARDLVPESNPFLRQFFNHIAGPDFNKRLRYIVDELCVVFECANVRELMEEYFKKNGATEGQDPVIHFYEDFLKEYDAALRKKMGAYYTPLPVVRFIVRAVDDVLKKEFGLAEGLADTSKLPSGLHRVQVLDPAVGTGTFISAVIRIIYERLIEQGQKGRWPAYVHHDLLPRIHGFELMMAAYTIAHLKLSIAFKQTGFTIFNKRLGIYLTNSLEQAGLQTDMSSLGFAQSIAEEAKQAAVIKNETPIMVVIGNPPYSGVSSNESEDVNRLVEKYKVEPGGKQKLQERKHWLNDDYVKFIALAESMIEKNEEGIVAMITSHGYIENPTFRGMRWHLRKTFDQIYVLDLHGNSNKKETSPDGSKDENVFNIKTGVSIILGIKNGKKPKDALAQVLKADLYGLREDKFARLDSGIISEISWIKLPQETELWVLEGKGKSEYLKGFSVAEMFPKNTTGIVTAIDRLSIFSTKEELEQTTQSILNSSDPYREFNIKDGRKYKKEERLKELREASVNEPTRISYRPFDTRYMYYTQKSECWINSPRSDVMQNYVNRDNLGLLLTKAVRDPLYNHVFLTKNISEVIFLSGTTATNAMNLPLYLYAEDGSRAPNLKKEIVAEIEKIVGRAKPEDIFDYIYAVLHSPSHREKYTEFLKIDFPRVPYPKDKKQFAALVVLGKELRELHLLESSKIKTSAISYPEEGSNVVEKIAHKDGRVYINAKQYFGNVSDVAWNFYIGGYQPAQKWLKDRKGLALTNEDIEHYQKMIVALIETDRIMKEIDYEI